jgi:RNA polymerase sigma factor (sigma-70 family)
VRNLSAAELVIAARNGDQGAWKELVGRYARMVWVIARQYRLSEQDAEDVSQTTWLLLATHLGKLKEPGAVGGWLATTARRESLRLARRRAREVPTDPYDAAQELRDDHAEHGEDVVLREEQADRVRRAFRHLPDRCQRLLALLMQEPAPSYDEISALLEMPRGSIGPTRARCLEQLRKVIDL